MGEREPDKGRLQVPPIGSRLPRDVADAGELVAVSTGE